jgi:hypothetical protein
MVSKKALVLLPLFLVMLASLSSVAAREITYLAMKPDTEFCISVIFGENGRGEYTLLIEDPGYPRRVWVDTHRASFTSGPSNPVINPVCFNTKNRRVGDEVILHFMLETPEEEILYDYGICVSNHEDADVVESDEDPCAATASHTDLFSLDLLESELFSIPNEKVTFTLLVSSEFDLRLSLDKESGPKMEISETNIIMPGEYAVKIDMDSPADPGDYAFTVVAKAENCDYSSCEKRVNGVLHVAQSPGMDGFMVELSPNNRNVVGMQSATFYLTIQNFEADQTFSVNIDLDESLSTNFMPGEMTIIRDGRKQIDFTVIPESDDHKLYMIRVEVEGEVGGKKTAESFLTVEEPASDAQRMAENDPRFRQDADDYADRYGDDASLDDWKSIQQVTTNDDNGTTPDGESSPLNWVMIVVAVAGIASIIFYIYKKTTVVQEGESPYFP